MSLFLSLASAALFLALPSHAPKPVAPVAVESTSEAAPRVEIGPAVLRVYDETGKVVHVE